MSEYHWRTGSHQMEGSNWNDEDVQCTRNFCLFTTLLSTVFFFFFAVLASIDQ